MQVPCQVRLLKNETGQSVHNLIGQSQTLASLATDKGLTIRQRRKEGNCGGGPGDKGKESRKNREGATPYLNHNNNYWPTYSGKVPGMVQKSCHLL